MTAGGLLHPNENQKHTAHTLTLNTFVSVSASDSLSLLRVNISGSFDFFDRLFLLARFRLCLLGVASSSEDSRSWRSERSGAFLLLVDERWGYLPEPQSPWLFGFSAVVEDFLVPRRDAPGNTFVPKPFKHTKKREFRVLRCEKKHRKPALVLRQKAHAKNNEGHQGKASFNRTLNSERALCPSLIYKWES